MAPPPVDPDGPSGVAALALRLAAGLDRVYPHGVTDSGRVRRSTPKEVRAVLTTLLRAVTDPAERRALALAVYRGAEAEARALAGDDDRRRFQPGLVVWLRRAGWEAPPTFARVRPDEASRRIGPGVQRDDRDRYGAPRRGEVALPPEVQRALGGLFRAPGGLSDPPGNVGRA